MHFDEESRIVHRRGLRPGFKVSFSYNFATTEAHHHFIPRSRCILRYVRSHLASCAVVYLVQPPQVVPSTPTSCEQHETARFGPVKTYP